MTSIRQLYANVLCSTIHYSQALEATQVNTTDKWIKKMWYIYTMEYYSAIKSNSTWFEEKWMQLEDIMLSEISQTQKDKGLMFFLTHRQ
jgi:hypothetical protein